MWQRLDQHKILLGLCLFLAAVLAYTTFVYKIPYKSYGDIWSHIASVQELTKPLAQVGDPYFNEGFRDPHYSPYFVTIAAVSNILKVNHTTVMEVFGILSTLLLFVACALIYARMFPNRQDKKMDLVILFLAVFGLWEGSRISYAGYFSLADAAITVPFPNIFAFALYILGLNFGIALLQLQKQEKQFSKNQGLLMAVLTVITILVLLTHTITAAAFVITAFICIAYYLVKEHNWSPPPHFWSIFLILPIAGLIAGIWPYYFWPSPFLNLQTVHTEAPLISIFELENWLQVAGICFVALSMVLAQKNRLLVIISVFFLIVLFSYLYPIRISSYWRFLPMALLPLMLMFTHWVSGLHKVIKTMLVFILILFMGSSFVNKVSTLAYRTPIDTAAYSFLTQVPQDKIIFSDPETSYIFSGLTGHPVLAIKPNHWNPSNWEAAQIRYEDSVSFWGNGAPGSLYVFDRYEIDYLLINKRIYPAYTDYATTVGKKYRTKELYQDRQYLLLSITR